MYSANEKVDPINVAEEVSRSFLDYSMSVIISRALPDARDGLKPSQRRILYAMHDLSLFPGRQHRKCAKICGDTSGNYHPHGEAVIYPTLVHMAQPWAMRETLVNGQGNFGSVICGVSGIKQYLETGRGSMKVRGKAGIEELKGGKEQIVITEIPYNVNRATLVERIASLVNGKVLTDISAVRDESDENTRVVIELKRDGNPKVVINNLYKHTAMESSFAVIMLAIDHGRPKLLSLKEANACYIEHRRDVVLRRTRFELRKAEERAETLEGYLIALANLDEFLRIIRGSASRDEARVKLLAFEFTKRQVEQIGILIRSEARLTNGRYAFSEHQADEILNLRLYQLTGLEREKIDKEYKELLESIKDLRDILAKEQRGFTIIKRELREIRDK